MQKPLQTAKAAGTLWRDLTINDIFLMVSMLQGAVDGADGPAARAAAARRALTLVLDGLDPQRRPRGAERLDPSRQRLRRPVLSAALPPGRLCDSSAGSPFGLTCSGSTSELRWNSSEPRDRDGPVAGRPCQVSSSRV